MRKYTFKKWMKRHFNKYELLNITEHGVHSAGVNGLNFYDEVVSLFKRFQEDIIHLVIKESKEKNSKNVFEMLSKLNGADVDNYNQFAMFLVSFAAEKYALQYTIGEIK